MGKVRHAEGVQELREAIQAGDSIKVSELIGRLHPADAAALVMRLLRKEQKQLFGLLNAGQAADVVETMDPELQAAVVQELPSEKASEIVEEMDSDKGADLLGQLPKGRKEELLREMEPEEAKTVRELLQYPPETAGGIMAKEFIAFPRWTKVKEVLEELRARAPEYDAYKVSYVYVSDEYERLVGVIRLRDLILKNPDLAVESIMIPDPIRVDVGVDQEEVAHLFKKYNLLALPVVTPEGQLAGIVTQDDAMEVLAKESSKDFLKFTGIARGEEFRDMPVLRRVWRRLSWLSINIVLNVIAASVIAFFEDTLRAVIALAVFLPIISDMSGCSGNQAVAVSIRELALGRIDPRKIRWVVAKEILVGFFNGLILGTQIGVIATFWRGIPMLGVVVALALWINTILSVLIGGTVPLLLKRFGFDPAMASGPILTTLTDMCGFFLILSLASLFLPLLV